MALRYKVLLTLGILVFAITFFGAIEQYPLSRFGMYSSVPTGNQTYVVFLNERGAEIDVNSALGLSPYDGAHFPVEEHCHWRRDAQRCAAYIAVLRNVTGEDTLVVQFRERNALTGTERLIAVWQ